MIDTATISVKAGNGGNGLVSFRRLKNNPKGGPWGGNGGEGASIYFEVDPHLNTLTPFKRERQYHAENGQSGMKDNKKGRNGDDMYIKVPPGTQVKNENGEILFDLINPGETQLIEDGGKGGLGNTMFKSSTNRTPMQSTPGETREKVELHLELKLIADVGVIGLPSSGKSTLLNSLTSSNAKTAEYHFTTLEPNLGVLHVNRYIPTVEKDIVIADIPGLIEGASEGKGLGHDFLRHVERTHVLIHVIDGAELVNYPPEKLIENYKTIQNELKSWAESLVDKPQIIVINKIDLSEVSSKKDEIEKAFRSELETKDSKDKNIKLHFVSAYTSEGLSDVVRDILELDAHSKSQSEIIKNEAEARRASASKKFTIDNLPNKRIIFN